MRKTKLRYFSWCNLRTIRKPELSTSSNFSFAKKIWIIYSIFILRKKFTWIFLIRSNYSFNFTSKKKFQIITLGKMFNYLFEFYFMKNSFNILQKKIYPNFLIKKCSITHSNFISQKIHSIYLQKKIYPNFISQKNTQIIYWFYDVTFYAKHFINKNMSCEIFQF